MAFQASLQLDGIDGQSGDERHKNEIELLSFDYGAEQPGSASQGSGLGAGKVSLSDINVVKCVDRASPKLLVTCCTGQHIQWAVITVRSAGGSQQDYLVLKPSDVLVRSIRGSAQTRSDDVSPTEVVSLSFARIELEYREQSPGGAMGDTVAGGYDLMADLAV